MKADLLNKILDEYDTPEKVNIRDHQATSKLIGNIAKMGSSSLQVITDFDATMTVNMPGHGGPFSRSHLMPPDYKERSKLRTQEYLQIEMSDLSMAEKSKQVLDVLTRGQTDIKSTGLTKPMFLEVMKGAAIPLRENTDVTLKRLESAGIPVIIFSAGVGNIIEETLRLNGMQHSNVHIISNFMLFDSDGDKKITGWTKPSIHTFNKNESVIPKDSPFFQTMDGSHRPNVILIGDSLGDVTMADGVQNLGTVLKIGFLNIHVEERLPSFLEAFDIVLVQDMTMNFVNLLLKGLNV